MSLFSDLDQRKAANAKKLAGLGVSATLVNGKSVRIVRKGTSTTIYTIGYERRDGENLISALRDQGVRAVVDVRERPVSR
jgi:hypothetical protein